MRPRDTVVVDTVGGDWHVPGWVKLMGSRVVLQTVMALDTRATAQTAGANSIKGIRIRQVVGSTDLYASLGGIKSTGAWRFTLGSFYVFVATYTCARFYVPEFVSTKLRTWTSSSFIRNPIYRAYYWDLSTPYNMHFGKHSLNSARTLHVGSSCPLVEDHKFIRST